MEGRLIKLRQTARERLLSSTAIPISALAALIPVRRLG
jgi:hypothetical protein